MIGSGLDVWEVVHMFEDFGSAEALLSETHVTPAQLRIALAYRDAYPSEVAEAIDDNRWPIADVDVLYPFIEVAGR